MDITEQVRLEEENKRLQHNSVISLKKHHLHMWSVLRRGLSAATAQQHGCSGSGPMRWPGFIGERCSPINRRPNAVCARL
jgi:hypothetical protein